MRVLISVRLENGPQWQQALQGADSQRTYILDDGVSRYEDAHILIAADPHPGVFSRAPKIQAVFSLWAGLEHITSHPEFSSRMPLYRMIEPGLRKGMADYVVGHVFKYHLRLPEQMDAQQQGQWREDMVVPLRGERRVGVMGLGTLGSYVAGQLCALGFEVSGWSRTDKAIMGVRCYHGQKKLRGFLEGCHIVVVLLPLSRSTAGLLNTERLGWLAPGSAVINAGRGGLIGEAALLEHLESGHIAHATLDVFHEEPLPADHVFWTHPKVSITPHIASRTRLDTGSAALVAQLNGLARGDKVPGRYSPGLDY